MANLKKVYIISGNDDYYDMFLNEGWEVVAKIETADLVVFTGGSDVSPIFYDESRHPKAYNDLARDQAEQAIYHRCVDLKIAMVGVCRG